MFQRHNPLLLPTTQNKLLGKFMNNLVYNLILVFVTDRKKLRTGTHFSFLIFIKSIVMVIMIFLLWSAETKILYVYGNNLQHIFRFS